MQKFVLIENQSKLETVSQFQRSNAYPLLLADTLVSFSCKLGFQSQFLKSLKVAVFVTSPYISPITSSFGQMAILP